MRNLQANPAISVNLSSEAEAIILEGIAELIAAKLEDPPSDDFRVLLLLPARPNNGADTTRGQLGRLIEADGDGDRLLRGVVPDEGRPLGVANGCASALEAREVLTFALAALSDPVNRAALEAELAARPYVFRDGVVDDWLQLPGGAVTGTAASDGASGVGFTGLWSRGAATLGLALANRVDVADLHAEWERWTDRETRADELVGQFDVPPLPSPVGAAGGSDAGGDSTCAEE